MSDDFLAVPFQSKLFSRKQPSVQGYDDGLSSEKNFVEQSGQMPCVKPILKFSRKKISSGCHWLCLFRIFLQSEQIGSNIADSGDFSKNSFTRCLRSFHSWASRIAWRIATDR